MRWAWGFLNGKGKGVEQDKKVHQWAFVVAELVGLRAMSLTRALVITHTVNSRVSVCKSYFHCLIYWMYKILSHPFKIKKEKDIKIILSLICISHLQNSNLSFPNYQNCRQQQKSFNYHYFKFYLNY